MCDRRHGKYIVCCLMHRGEVVPKEARSQTRPLRRSRQSARPISLNLIVRPAKRSLAWRTASTLWPVRIWLCWRRTTRKLPLIVRWMTEARRSKTAGQSATTSCRSVRQCDCQRRAFSPRFGIVVPWCHCFMRIMQRHRNDATAVTKQRSRRLAAAAQRTRRFPVAVLTKHRTPPFTVRSDEYARCGQ